MEITALIMAGGRGERFWPRSRKNLPKQFLSLTEDKKTMLQLTIERILPIVKLEDIFIATSIHYKDIILKQIPEFLPENIICEPIRKNTAPCIGVGAMYISKKYQDALMLVLPSDHLIKYNDIFISTLKKACNIAEQGENLVTIGITPNYPETEYGYIKFNSKIFIDDAFAVEHFVEKPNKKKAEEYIKTGNYLWNSGMFVWKTSSILKNIEQHLKDIYNGLQKIQKSIGSSFEKDVLKEEFIKFQSQSIDYGVMEKAKNIYTIPSTFGWDDVGSWLAVDRINTSNEYGNIIQGNILTINTKNCIIEGTEKLIAIIGLEDTIVVDSDNALLVCKKEDISNVKKVVESLKICNKEEYI
ncbi:MAG: mannose-1-phosphate guanylyltransferase [Lachnospiraceae bacterium]|jgi:mannose-1-phosphate guanylyltransferase|nr:mannose-1-phosphate guanylyltransferase [Lachnospiraceae bacterium]